MNLESIIGSQAKYHEEAKTHEGLVGIRDFGAIKAVDLDKIIENNSSHWRLPTAGEMFTYFKENKKLFSKFFKYDYYWAKDINTKNNIFVATSKNGKFWYTPSEERGAQIGLVMIKVDSKNPEPTEEERLPIV